MLNRTKLLSLGTLLATGSIAAPATAGTFTTLFDSFNGGSDGAYPSSSAAYDEKGNVYGTAGAGGDAACFEQNSGQGGCGTVYKISPSGQETTLVTFTGPNGKQPQGQLTLIDQTLYGCAVAGGVNNRGVLFSVNTDGKKFELLHKFQGSDGTGPVCPLVPGPAGAFYGMAYSGGPASKNSSQGGVLFELLPDGTYIHLHDFTGGADGNIPSALLIDPSGTLYGSTQYGGNCCQGVVYQYVPATSSFAVLNQFTETQGSMPMLGSIGPDGTLYGATRYGGTFVNGTLFQMVPAGGPYSFTTLYSFGGSRIIGDFPSAGPIMTRYGALIGTTTEDGASLYRFKYNKMKPLYDFHQETIPLPPTLDKDGTIYGTSNEGGNNCSISPNGLGCGYVYSFVP